MNAPLAKKETAPAAAGALRLFAVFHLNLAFSSIEEESRGTVIERCYWPLLRLADRHGPIGIEATGYTLEEIARRDPDWIARARALLARGRIELIGSGYAQIIGPLVPWRVTEANLRIGNDAYRRLLGGSPSIALVNEQAYAGGLVGHYLDAGYGALLMDWDNPGAHHPEWPSETRYAPQRALGADGRSIALLWTNTVAFQKLQRYAHGDIGLEEYLSYMRGHLAAKDRILCAYAGDAEIFDFRPGRYRTEEALCDSEWERLDTAFALMASEPGFALASPSQVLSAGDAFDTMPLRIESAACPIPVKKQRKYNLSRWAVTGRDDLGINAACQRIHDGLVASKADEAAWKELCYLWASDFRTHITDRRWAAYCLRLAEMEARWGAASPSAAFGGTSPAGGGGKRLGQRPEFPPPFTGKVPRATREAEGGDGSQSPSRVASRHIDIALPSSRARLDRRRGLAIDSLQFASHAKPALGGLRHGHFDDIALQADWYTGDCVFEAPGEHKVTDLEWCEAQTWRDARGDILVAGRIETPKGPIEKTLRFAQDEPRVDFDLTFHWTEWGRGSLRLGHFTLLPDAFDWLKLSLTTHNGGKDCESFALAGTDVDHGAPVSFLVSSSHGLGMTEGWAELGDDKTRVRIAFDRATAPLMGLLTHRRTGGSLFCQLGLSALELDDTRKPCAWREGPRRFQFSVSAV